VTGTWFAVATGLRRGRIEFRQALASPADLGSMLVFVMLTLVALVFLRGVPVTGSRLSLGSLALPGALGMQIASMGMTIMSQLLTIDREDGTLLRAKAIPGGMVGYFTGRVVLVAGMTVIGLLLLLIPGLFLTDGVGNGDAGSWLALVAILALGLVATLPIGAVLGSLFPSPRSGGLIMLPFFGLTAISGIFYPLTRFPVWLQDIAQVFPIYWLGLGMRSALLPDDLAVVEIGGSWRHLATYGVLGTWAVLGLAVAPAVLRRMARRESGSIVAVRRERALRRAG
jgi:ABC-2 type transport system permease protein